MISYKRFRLPIFITINDFFYFFFFKIRIIFLSTEQLIINYYKH